MIESMIRKLAFLLGALVITGAVYEYLQPGMKGNGLDRETVYERVPNWPDLPQGMILGNPTGIGIDKDKHIVVFHRADRKWENLGSMPREPIQHETILILDKETGKLVSSWGRNMFIMPHGLKIDREDNVWVTDVGLHQVFKFSHSGQLLMRLGKAGVPGNDSLHFNLPTDIAIQEDGSFYVSDGYGNSRVVKFSPTGKYLFEWGRKGDGEGEFDIPHGLSLDGQGNVYVADRENKRIQVFDAAGKFKKQIADHSVGNVCAVAVAHEKLFMVDDISFFKLKHLGSDVFIVDASGRIQTRFGRSGSYHGGTAWYHDLVIDHEENIYVGDILGNTIQKFKKGVRSDRTN